MANMISSRCSPAQLSWRCWTHLAVCKICGANINRVIKRGPGPVAAEVAAGHKAAFDATVIPGVAYTHPEVAWVGYTEAQAKAEGKKVDTAKFPWAASGRAIANGADYGFTKLIFDAETHRVIGGTIVGPSAGDMIGEVCLAIEMGADATDIGKTIHPHPTLGETVGMAAEVAHGSCTDLPPMRKK